MSPAKESPVLMLFSLAEVNLRVHVLHVLLHVDAEVSELALRRGLFNPALLDLADLIEVKQLVPLVHHPLVVSNHTGNRIMVIEIYVD